MRRNQHQYVLESDPAASAFVSAGRRWTKVSLSLPDTDANETPDVGENAASYAVDAAIVGPLNSFAL